MLCLKPRRDVCLCHGIGRSHRKSRNGGSFFRLQCYRSAVGNGVFILRSRYSVGEVSFKLTLSIKLNLKAKLLIFIWSQSIPCRDLFGNGQTPRCHRVNQRAISNPLRSHLAVRHCNVNQLYCYVPLRYFSFRQSIDMAGRDIFKGDSAALVRCSFPLPIPIVLTGQRKLGSFKYFSVRSLFGENQISGKAFHLGNRKGACLYVSPHSIGAYRIRQFCRIIDLYASLIRVLHRQIIQLDRIVQRISKCPCNCSVLVLRVV